MLEVYLPVTGDIKFSCYNTVCVVCLKSLTECSLQKCAGCKLVFYCSKEHQKTHWKNHKQLCKAVQMMIKRTGNVGLFDDYVDEGSSLWFTFRKSMIYICEGIMKRKMTLEEKNLFLYPFCCQVCHVHIHNRMITCSNCGVICYCSEDHKEKDKECHLQVCEQLKFCLDFDRNCQGGYFIEAVVEDIHKLTSDMQHFVVNHVSIHTKPPGKEAYAIKFMSLYLSMALTIIYVIEKSEIFRDTVNENLTLHIVGSSQYENFSWWSWEYIFHYFKNLKSIKVVFIGPESSDFFLPPSLSCQDCKNSRNINFCAENTLYHEYIEKRVDKPDIILAFNCGFHEFENMPQHDSWKSSMKSLCSFSNRILAFTSYNENESTKDLKLLRKFCENTRLEVLVQCEENPYRSLLPMPDWFGEGGDVFYNNYFINIVRT